MKRFILIFSVILFLSNISFAQKTSKVVFKDCSAQEFLQKLNETENAVVIDTRSAKQYKRNRIKGAVLAGDFNAVKKILQDKPKDTPLFIYCETGDNSISIAALLMRNGYTHIYHLHNGLDDWWRAGYKLDKTKIKNIAQNYRY